MLLRRGLANIIVLEHGRGVAQIDIELANSKQGIDHELNEAS